ncbi:MAG: DNA (cytosine-5-)-methyltransferase [Methanosphaera stadtmanae]|jgi:DNA (cytosine-5)-methyltransferase 1|nr:DNA (cytosine-5-)-methyltransferase [Methanosphaera stadtmanae]
MEKTVAELFAGVGGFRCGLNHVKLKNDLVTEDDTWNFVYANQWEPSTKSQAAYDCYVKRFGKTDSHINQDINKVDKNNIPDHNLLVGGFPCQDYSVARTLSNEKGIQGKKGVLWWDIIDTIESKNPPFILLENVDRLLRSPSSQRGRDFGVMLRSLNDNGYSVQWRVINAADYGFPQKRRRVFIFAYHKTTKYYKEMLNYNLSDIIFKEGIFAKVFPIKQKSLDKSKGIIDKDKYVDLVDVSDNFHLHFFNTGIMINGEILTHKTEPISTKTTNLGDILEQNAVDEKYFLDGEKLEKFTYLKGKKRIERTHKNGSKYIFAEGSIPFPDKLDVPARTMLTSESTTNRSSHVVKDVKTGKLRTLTPIEAERINMFPDNWTNINEKSMTERRRYFMMGNALVVGIIDKLGEYLKEIFDNED